jgi:hypothetical protein
VGGEGIYDSPKPLSLITVPWFASWTPQTSFLLGLRLLTIYMHCANFCIFHSVLITNISASSAPYVPLWKRCLQPYLNLRFLHFLATMIHQLIPRVSYLKRQFDYNNSLNSLKIHSRRFSFHWDYIPPHFIEQTDQEDYWKPN